MDWFDKSAYMVDRFYLDEFDGESITLEVDSGEVESEGIDCDWGSDW